MEERKCRSSMNTVLSDPSPRMTEPSFPLGSLKVRRAGPQTPAHCAAQRLCGARCSPQEGTGPGQIKQGNHGSESELRLKI